MKITELLTKKEMEIMDQKTSITGQPDREFLLEFIGDHYKELEIKDLLLLQIANELHAINFTNTIPETVKEKNWFE